MAEECTVTSLIFSTFCPLASWLNVLMTVKALVSSSGIFHLE